MNTKKFIPSVSAQSTEQILRGLQDEITVTGERSATREDEMAKPKRSISFTRKGEFLAQATIDLRDARCDGLSAYRRFECAYDAALHAATSVLGETYTHTHGDLAIFDALENQIRAEIQTEAHFMVRLRQTEDRRRYEGLTSITETDVARAIALADRVRVGALKHFKHHAND